MYSPTDTMKKHMQGVFATPFAARQFFFSSVRTWKRYFFYCDQISEPHTDALSNLHINKTIYAKFYFPQLPLNRLKECAPWEKKNRIL